VFGLYRFLFIQLSVLISFTVFELTKDLFSDPVISGEDELMVIHQNPRLNTAVQPIAPYNTLLFFWKKINKFLTSNLSYFLNENEGLIVLSLNY
jgi:hypothetical protein